MRDNFLFGMKAISRDMVLFLSDLVHNKILWGFSFGILLTVLIVGFFITKNPKQIPVILQYSATEGFQKLSEREQNGTYQTSYSTFIKIHAQIRMLFLIATIALCVMITTMVMMAK
jgi:hypothetical protein